jgi:glycosyltransferase involved in cell wall biosynthesis
MGGGSTRASNVVKGLLSRGCEVKVVAAFPHYPHGDVPEKYRGKPIVSERFNDAKVLRVWIPSLPHSGIVNRVVLHLCFVFSSLFALPFVGGVDVVWAANPNLFCFYSAVVYGFVKRKPIVRNVDDLWPEVFYELGLVRSGLVRRLLDFLAWFSYVVPAAITPISHGYERRIVERYGVCAEKIHVVEVGVDRVEPLNVNEGKKGRFVVMYSGVLGLGYDFDVVLEAARILRDNEDIVFLIRGVGELAPWLRNRVSELGLGNVVLDTSFLPKEKLSALLGSADVFVLPMASMSFVEEGLPTKVFEYQAYGKPIICVSDGEPAGYIGETKSGIVVKPRDYEALAKAVLYLKENRSAVEKMGESGRHHVENNMSIEKVGWRLKRIFEALE